MARTTDRRRTIVTLTHALSGQEVDMLIAIRVFMMQGTGRSPKAYEVGGRAKYRHRPTPGSIQAFDRLKALGLVVHRPNGHCWLSEDGGRVLNSLTIDNAHHWAGDTP